MVVRTLFIIPALISLAATAQATDRKPLKQLVADLAGPSASARETAQSEIEAFCEPFGYPYDDSIGFDPETRKWLMAYRREATPLLPEILKLLDRDDPDVVASAAALLSVAGPEAKAAIPKLKSVVENSRPLAMVDDSNALVYNQKMMGVYLYALPGALVSVWPPDKPVTPQLLKLVAKARIEQFGNFDLKELYEPKEDATQMTTRHNWHAVSFMIDLLARSLLSSGRTRIEVPVLAQAASDESSTTMRIIAMGVLAEFGNEATAALPTLRQCLKDKNIWLRRVAAQTILQIERDPSQIESLIVSIGLSEKQSRDFDEDAREQFAQIRQEEKELIDRLKGGGEESLPMCLGMLKHGRNFHQRKALAYLAMLGPAAKSAVPALKERLNDHDEEIRKLAAEVLRRIEAKPVAEQPTSPERDR